ncbi:hypothetical protein [Clavibacter michiganensis]|uniref:hypothetical protein n=2 Tax=Clavibacter michiganensis TaxID=28447 RepID=UPI00292D14C7|nr:hypothetical protein [Clavibacter michiganensis]
MLDLAGERSVDTIHSSSKADINFIGGIAMSKNAFTNRFLTGVVGVAVASLALTGLAAGPASAATAPTAAAPASAAVELPVTGGVFAEVEKAPTLAEKKAILESNGYVNTTGNTYESTVDGFTIGTTLPDEPRKDVVSPQWSTGVNIIRPYIQGTLPEWQAAVDASSTPATVACAFITASVGAAACAAVIQKANEYIQEQNFSGTESICIRAYLFPVVSFEPAAC